MPSPALAACAAGNRLQNGAPKIIYYGQSDDSPSPTDMVANQGLMQSRAAQFDGIAMYIPTVISKVISPTALSQATISAEFTGWTAANFGTMTHNWATVFWWGNEYGPGTGAVAATDWTNNTHWSQIATNFGNLATVLRDQGKCAGIFFDNEAYIDGAWTQNTYPFNWGGDSNGPTDTAANGLGVLPSHTRPAALSLAYDRGKQVMDAIVAAWPECHVMFLHSAFASDYYAGEAMNTTLATGFNNLWWTSELKGAFAYGMLKSVVTSGKGHLWDGGEMYGIRSQHDQYQAARFRQYVAPRVANQWLYTDALRDHRLLVSQGMFDRDEFNSYALQTASAIKNQLIWAGRENGSYIWLYTENNNWMGAAGSGKTAVAQSYLDAVAEARSALRGGAATSGGGGGGGGGVSETWTGSNGSSWPSPWATSNGSAGGFTDIQSNQGRMVVPTNGADGARAWYGSTNYASVDVTVELAIPSTVPNPSYRSVVVRADTWAGNGDFPSNGYMFQARPHTNTVHLFEWVSGGATQLAAPSYTFTPGTNVNIRVQVSGSALRCRLWNVGSSEPGTWLIDTTDTTRTTGLWGLSASGTSNADVRWDNLTGTIS